MFKKSSLMGFLAIAVVGTTAYGTDEQYMDADERSFNKQYYGCDMTDLHLACIAASSSGRGLIQRAAIDEMLKTRLVINRPDLHPIIGFINKPEVQLMINTPKYIGGRTVINYLLTPEFCSSSPSELPDKLNRHGMKWEYISSDDKTWIMNTHNVLREMYYRK